VAAYGRPLRADPDVHAAVAVLKALPRCFDVDIVRMHAPAKSKTAVTASSNSLLVPTTSKVANGKAADVKKNSIEDSLGSETIADEASTVPDATQATNVGAGEEDAVAEKATKGTTVTSEQSANQLTSAHVARQTSKESGSGATMQLLNEPQPKEGTVAQARNALEDGTRNGTTSSPAKVAASPAKPFHENAPSGLWRSDHRSKSSSIHRSTNSSSSNSSSSSSDSGAIGRSGSNSRDSSRSGAVPAAFRINLASSSNLPTSALPTAFRQFRVGSLPAPSSVPTAFRTKPHDNGGSMNSSNIINSGSSGEASPSAPLTPLTVSSPSRSSSTLFSPPLSPEEARTMARAGRYTSPSLSPENERVEDAKNISKTAHNKGADCNNTAAAATNAHETAETDAASDSAYADSDAEFTPFDALRSHFALGTAPNVSSRGGSSPMFESKPSPHNRHQNHEHRGTQVNLAAAAAAAAASVGAADSDGFATALTPHVATDDAATTAAEPHLNNERSSLVPSPTNVAEFDEVDQNHDDSIDKKGGRRGKDTLTACATPQPANVEEKEEVEIEDSNAEASMDASATDEVLLPATTGAAAETTSNEVEMTTANDSASSSSFSSSFSKPSSKDTDEFNDPLSAPSLAPSVPLQKTMASPSPPPQVLLAADSGWENVGAPFAPPPAAATAAALSGLDRNFLPRDIQRGTFRVSPTSSPYADHLLHPQKEARSARPATRKAAFVNLDARPWLRFVLCVVLAVAAGGVGLAAFRHNHGVNDHSLHPLEGGNTVLKQRPLGRWARQPQPLDVASEASAGVARGKQPFQKEAIDVLLEPGEQLQPRLVPPSAFGVVRIM